MNVYGLQLEKIFAWLSCCYFTFYKEFVEKIKEKLAQVWPAYELLHAMDGGVLSFLRVVLFNFRSNSHVFSIIYYLAPFHCHKGCWSAGRLSVGNIQHHPTSSSAA